MCRVVHALYDVENMLLLNSSSATPHGHPMAAVGPQVSLLDNSCGAWRLVLMEEMKFTLSKSFGT